MPFVSIAEYAAFAVRWAGLDRDLEKQKAARRATGVEVTKLNQTIPLMIDRLTAKQTLLEKGPLE